MAGSVDPLAPLLPALKVDLDRFSQVEPEENYVYLSPTEEECMVVHHLLVLKMADSLFLSPQPLMQTG